MSGISVTVHAPTPAGRLYPRYDRGVNYLIMQSEVDRPWVEGFDIDASIILDLDKDLLPANIDLHIPMRSWEQGLSHTFDWSAPAGDLAFARDVLDQPEINVPVQCRTDADRRIVHIEIGSTRHDRTVALSDKCLALLAGDELVGFVARDFDGRV